MTIGATGRIGRAGAEPPPEIAAGGGRAPVDAPVRASVTGAAGDERKEREVH